MKIKIKIKYPVQILAFALIFFIYTAPVLASQISVNSVFNLINQDREKQGLNDLGENNQLTKVAQDKLNDMIENHYFAHTSPAGVSPWYWYKKNGYDYQYAGENLAINFLTNEAQNQAWMNSPDHRKNILNPKYFETGIAVGAGTVNGQNSIITVEEFGTLSGVAEAMIAGRNFSGQKKANLIKRENMIVPQVLAIKNSSTNKLETANDSAMGDFGLKQNKLAIINFTSELFAFFLLASFALSPMAFLSVALEKIITLWQTNKNIPEKV